MTETAETGVRVVHKPVPFSLDRQVRILEPGYSVKGILEQLEVPAGAHVVVTIGSSVVPERFYAHVRPKRGTLVGVHVVPQGQTGKAILQIVVGIGLILSAPFSPAGLLQGIAGVAAIYNGAQSIAAPTPRVPYAGDVATSKQSPTLTSGTRNAFSPFAPVVERFGRLLAVPEYAAKPFTELVGSDTYLRLLFDFGVGPLELSEHKLGATPLSSFEGVEYVVHEGWDDDPELSLFTQDVDEEPLGIEFEHPTTRTTPSAWDSRNTEPNSTEASLDWSLPGGLIAFNEDGAPLEVTISMQVQYRVAGSSDPWVDVPATAPLGPGVEYDGTSSPGDFNISGKERGFIRRGIRWVFPSAGQWEVRMRRRLTEISGASFSDETVAEELQWAVLRSIRPTTKPTLLRTNRNLCLVEMRILATGQLGQVLDNYNAVSERWLRVWNALDGYGPPEVLKTNPAFQKTRGHVHALSYVLRSVLADSRLDSAGLAAAQAVLNGEGRTFDAAVDFRSTVRAVASDIAASARGKLSLVDGRYTVVLDRPVAEVTHVFTPRNVTELTAERLFRKKTHALRVNFGPHEAEGWIASQRVVFNDGYSEDGAGGTEIATEFGELDLWGVTDPDVAYTEGRYHLATSELQPLQLEVHADVESILATTGDRVRVHSDTIKQGLGAGRIQEVTIGGGLFSYLTLDEELTYDASKAYAMQIRAADGSSYVIPLANLSVVPNSTSTLFVAEGGSFDLDGAGYTHPAVGDLVVFGELGKEAGDYLVISVRYGGELSGVLQLLPYNEAIYTSDTEEIPDWEPNISDPTPPAFAVPAVPAIESIRSDESVLDIAPDGTLLPRVEVVVSYPGTSAVPASVFQAQYRQLEPVGEWRTLPFVDVDVRQIFIEGVQPGQVLEIRVRAVTSDNRVSGWATAPPHEVVGTTSPPPDVSNVFVEPPGDTLVWTYPDPPRDFAGFRVRHQAGSVGLWSTGIAAHDGLVTETRFDLSGLPAGERTVLVKAVDRAGNESVNAALVVLDVGDALDLNVVDSKDFHALGFTGTKTDCTVNGTTGDLEADTNALFWTGDDLAQFWSGTDSDLFWTQNFLAWSYEDSWSPSASGRLFVDLLVVGSNSFELLYREQGDSTFRPWPGSLNALSTKTYEFKLRGSGGGTQAMVQTFVAQIDLPDLLEYLNDQSVAATGVVRFAPSKSFTAIENVQVAIQNAVGGDQVVVLDKNPTSGPSIEVRDVGNVRVARTVDLQYQGY